MTKQLKVYFTFISLAIAGLNAATDKDEIRNLLQLHTMQISAFQHERLVHLLVTMFFGLVWFTCMICTTVWPVWQFIALDLIVLGLLGFYIKHYFFLENTLQKLYPMTQILTSFLNITQHLKNDSCVAP